MSKEINAYVEAFEALNFSFENQKKKNLFSRLHATTRKRK